LAGTFVRSKVQMHDLEPTFRKYVWLVGLCVLLFLLPFVYDNRYVLHVMIQIFALAFLAQSWNIMCGYTGQLSFGHAVFFGLGAYSSSLLFIKTGTSPWIGMLLGGVLALIVGMIIGYLAFRCRLRGVYFAFGTMAIAEIFRLLVNVFENFTQGAEGILLPLSGHRPLMFFFSIETKHTYFYLIGFAMLIFVTILAAIIKQIRFGYFLMAIRENEDAAEMIGINARRYKTVSIGLSAFLTALGGTFYAQYYQHFEPGLVFGLGRSFDIIFPVVLGGGGYVAGPLVGSVIMTVFEELTRSVLPSNLYGSHRMVYGLLLVVIIMYLPKGITSLYYKYRGQHSSVGASHGISFES
jgi:branched-chain amino acid transport system permease protein